MPKKGGKKHNKNKNKGAGGGGAKIPDVKNVISPGHKEEDKLLYGEGTAAEATTAAETAPATSSGSATAETAATAAVTAPKTEEALAQDTTKPQPTEAVPEKEAQELPVREKDVVPTEVTKEKRGDERTEALAAAAPTGTKKEQAEEDVAKETKIAQPEPEPEPEHPVTSLSTDRADLVADTPAKAEPVVAPTMTGVSDTVPDVPKKDQIEAEGAAAAVTAGVTGTAAGATAIAGGKTAEEDRTQPVEAGLEKKETAKEAPAQLPAEEQPQDSTEVATTTPLVAPHIKRAHEVPAFVTQERDQPPKKPRVDEPTESQPNLAIPGRFPSPSVAGSTASGTDSAVASEAQNISKGETVADKPEVAGTVAAQPAGSTAFGTESAVASDAQNISKGETVADKPEVAGTVAAATSTQAAGSTAFETESAVASEAQNISKGETVADKPEVAGTVAAATSTQPAGTKGPTEAAVTAPAPKPATEDAKAHDQISTAGAGAGAGAAASAARPAEEISAQKEPVLPVTPQKVETTAKPADQPAAPVQAQPTAEQQPASAVKEPKDVAPSKPDQQTPAQKEAKKGGFMTWLKRKFKGEKNHTASSSNGNGH